MAVNRRDPTPLRAVLSRTAGLLFVFILRILIGQAYYIVTYALGIYLLNLFLAFLQPKFDPSIELDAAEVEVEEGAPGLPTSTSADGEEARPFIRRLPEFRFWLASTRAILISLVCTIFPIFDVPVYWPILLIYCASCSCCECHSRDTVIALFGLTMRRQIEHMRKYRYVPWNTKPKFGQR